MTFIALVFKYYNINLSKMLKEANAFNKYTFQKQILNKLKFREFD